MSFLVAILIWFLLCVIIYKLTNKHGKQGIASMDCCCGVTGRTKATDYLNEMCCDCPYFVYNGKGY